MPRMIRELERNRVLGLVSARYCLWGRTIAVVQCWKSFEHLERYARNDDYEHRPVWLEFYRAASKSGSTVGIFHETYVVAPGATASLYFNMPPDFGLTGVTGAIPVTQGGRPRANACMSLVNPARRHDRMRSLGGYHSVP